MTPNRLDLPVLSGDGSSPRILKAVRALADLAVKTTSRGARSIQWIECERDVSLFATSVKETGFGLAGATAGGSPGGTASREFLAGLGPSLSITQANGGPLVLSFPSEGETGGLVVASGAYEATPLLESIRDRVPEVLRRVRFGNRDRVSSYMRASGRRETPFVELEIEVLALSRNATLQFVSTALELALGDGRRTVTLVRTPEWPALDDDLVTWTYQLVDEVLSQRVFSKWEYMRCKVAEHETYAEDLKRRMMDGGAAFLTDSTFAEAVATAAAAGPQHAYICASASAARLLLAAASGVSRASSTLAALEANHAVCGVVHGTLEHRAKDGSADPTAHIAAAGAVLRRAGWNEAADALATALRKASTLSPWKDGAGAADRFTDGVRALIS